uniref:SJCHGC06799 protein n=1 Tax=Schistosoma japonicum TaxID=6182 RepID=Q5DFP5_SCHJA|nr:SJCHGC06799 protein [Schistosoma japonicum]
MNHRFQIISYAVIFLSICHLGRASALILSKIDETEESTSPSSQSLNEEITEVQEVETTNESIEHEHLTSTTTETVESSFPSSQSSNDQTTGILGLETTTSSTGSMSHSSSIPEIGESTFTITGNTTDPPGEIVTIKDMAILGPSSDTIPPQNRFPYINGDPHGSRFHLPLQNWGLNLWEFCVIKPFWYLGQGDFREISHQSL